MERAISSSEGTTSRKTSPDAETASHTASTLATMASLTIATRRG